MAVSEMMSSRIETDTPHVKVWVERHKTATTSDLTLGATGWTGDGFTIGAAHGTITNAKVLNVYKEPRPANMPGQCFIQVRYQEIKTWA